MEYDLLASGRRESLTPTLSYDGYGKHTRRRTINDDKADCNFAFLTIIGGLE